VPTFTGQVTTALSAFRSAAPNAKIFLSSIPDVTKLWTLLSGSFSARTTWALFKICQSALGPSADRAAVRAQIQAYNAALATACTSIDATAPGTCAWDDNAVFDTSFTTADVSTVDYFHPSVKGQAKLAETTWAKAKAYFGWTG
jgi:hypothetical protein